MQTCNLENRKNIKIISNNIQFNEMKIKNINKKETENKKQK